MSASGGRYEPIWDPDAAGPIEVGIDIIEIERIGQVLSRFGDRFLNRIYSSAERQRYSTRVPELAARFAAKEATMKALGTGIRGVRWRDIETLPNRRGKPIIVLHGTAAARAEMLGLHYWSVSLTHSRTEAMATVIASRSRSSLE